MKLKQNNLETKKVGEFGGEIASSIRKQDLGIALGAVSRNLYSDSISSMVRELASNGVDANTEAGSEKPVLVIVDKEGDDYYIEVKDEGLGMSANKFKNTYMKWFNSDKRDSDENIGGWGLGSKTPLAYQDSYEITTINNGILNSYIVGWDTETNLPIATLLENSVTDKNSGTIVKVIIKNYDDVWKFYQACVKQLAYFNNVYVKHNIYGYDNHFKIYENEFYKLRNQDRPFGDEMHIALGQVAYPINWNTLGIPRVDIPVAIKFDISELEVTLSREEINYTEPVIALVLEKIEKVKCLLINKYEEQLKMDDFFSYLRVVGGLDKKPKLKIKGIEINMSNIKTKVSFSHYPDLDLKKEDISNFLSMFKIQKLSFGKLTENFFEKNTIIHQNENLFYLQDSINGYDSKYIDNGFIISKRKIRQKYFKFIANKLNRVIYNHEPTSSTNIFKTAYKENTAHVVYNLIKFIESYVIKKIPLYDGIAPEKWKEQIRQEQKELTQARKELITYYNLDGERHTISYGYLADQYKFVFYADRRSNPLDCINYNYLFENLPDYYVKKTTTYKNVKGRFKGQLVKQKIQVKPKIKLIFVNPTTVKKIRKKEGFKHISDVFKISIFKNHFNRLRVSYLIRQKLWGSYVFNYSTYYSKFYNFITQNYKINTQFNTGKYLTVNKQSFRDHEGDYYLYFKDTIDNISLQKKKNLTINQLQYEDKINKLIELHEKLDILNYIKLGSPDKYIREIISNKKVLKFNENYYGKDNNKQKEIYEKNNTKSSIKITEDIN